MVVERFLNWSTWISRFEERIKSEYANISNVYNVKIIIVLMSKVFYAMLINVDLIGF